MKKIILLLAICFSCTKEEIQINEVFNLKKPINSVSLSTDSLNVYTTDDWFSVSTKKVYTVSTQFYHTDTLGSRFNLTSIIKKNEEDFYVTYELGLYSKSVINILDKTGLIFMLKTESNELDTLKIKLYQNQILIYQYNFPYIVSTP